MDQKSGPVASRWNSFADIAIRCAGIAKVLISRDTGHVEFVDRHLSSKRVYQDLFRSAYSCGLAAPGSRSRTIRGGGPGGLLFRDYLLCDELGDFGIHANRLHKQELVRIQVHAVRLV